MMGITSLRWANPEQTALIVDDERIARARVTNGYFEIFDGINWSVLAVGPIEPFRDLNDARRIRVLEVKTEARRRILALVPGCTLENRDEKQINALMQAVLRIYDAVELLANADTAGAKAIVRELAPTAAKARKIVAIRAASDRFEDLVMNSPANPVSWEIAGPSMWP